MSRDFQDLIIDHLATEIEHVDGELSVYLKRRIQSVWRECDLRSWEFAELIGIELKQLNRCLEEKLLVSFVVEKSGCQLRQPYLNLEFVAVEFEVED